MGVRCFDKLLDQGQAGDYATVLVRGLSRWRTYHGQMLTTPKRNAGPVLFEATAAVLCREDGGRSEPFETGFVAQFHFDTATLDGTITLPDGVVAYPGDGVDMRVKLNGYIPGLRPGSRVTIREDGLTVAAAIVVKAT